MLTRPQWANKYAEREEKKLGADFAAETPRGLGLFEINSLPRQERGRLFDARRERFFRRFECAQVRAAKSRVIIELEEMVERTRAPSNTIDALLLKAIFSALYGQAKRKTYAFTFAGARYEFRTDLLVHESAPALPKLSKRLLTEKEVKRDELLARRRTCEAVARLEAQVAAIKRMPGLTRKERQDRRELLNALGLGNLMFLAEPTSENYMLSDKNLAEFQRSAGFCPVIDLCCDELGANARAPLSYDARADALCQGAHIEGKDLFCNPPFTKMLKFAKLLDDAHARDARTRAMLVIPYRKSLHWFYDHVLKKPHWRVAHCWPRGNDLFSSVAKSGSDAF